MGKTNINRQDESDVAVEEFYNLDLNLVAQSTMDLNQNAYSVLANQRFVEAIHDDCSPLERAVSKPGELKSVHEQELKLDNFDYFIETQDDVSEDFYSELVQSVGKVKADLFIETITKYWFDASKHQSARLVGLKRAVRDYLLTLCPNGRFVSKKGASAFKKPSTFSVQEISKILTLNDQYMHKHIHAWLEGHENSLQMGLSDVFLRRGISLARQFCEAEPYIEWDYLNSYSIATTVSEQFTYLGTGEYKAILSADLSLFDGRILFFAPFIKGMPTNQLEVGIIPPVKPLSLINQGCHNEIYEYRVIDKETEDFVRNSCWFLKDQ